jgi:hypothetical protein
MVAVKGLISRKANMIYSAKVFPYLKYLSQKGMAHNVRVVIASIVSARDMKLLA